MARSYSIHGCIRRDPIMIMSVRLAQRRVGRPVCVLVQHGTCLHCSHHSPRRTRIYRKTARYICLWPTWVGSTELFSSTVFSRCEFLVDLIVEFSHGNCPTLHPCGRSTLIAGEGSYIAVVGGAAIAASIHNSFDEYMQNDYYAMRRLPYDLAVATVLSRLG